MVGLAFFFGIVLYLMSVRVTSVPSKGKTSHHTHKADRCKPACGKESLADKIIYNPVENILIPASNNCNFHGFAYADSFNCMRNAWVIFLGGSVTCVNAHRTASFFQSGGKETGYMARKNITKEFRKNYDVVYKTRDPKMKEYATPAVHVSATLSPEMTADRAIKFLDEANNANFNSLSSDDKVNLRITFLNDQYFAIVPKLANQLGRLRKGLTRKGITRVFLIIGPTGKWFEMCEPLQVQRFPTWACPAKFLQKKNSDELVRIYRSEVDKSIAALIQARQKNVLSGSVILSYKTQYGDAVQKAIEKAAKSLENSSFLPVHQQHYYWNWFSTPLTSSLTPKDYREEFQGHPTGRSSHWYWMLSLTALCPTSSLPLGGCPKRPVFTAKCFEDYMYTVNPNTLLLSRGTKLANGLPTWQQGMEIKGCAITLANYSVLHDQHYNWYAAMYPNSINNGAKTLKSIEAAEHHHSRQWEIFVLSLSLVVISFYLFAAYRENTSAIFQTRNGRSTELHQSNDTLRIDSIVFSRYISSVHVVAGHMQQKGVTLLPLPKHVISWGFTWVPFFFMLSGFVLTYVKVIKVPPTQVASLKVESPLEFVWKRAMNTYPLYFSGLVASGPLLGLTTLSSRVAPSMVLQEVFLAQAWFPDTIESTLQAHCWFISCEVLYWALFPSILLTLDKLSRKGIAGVVLLCAFIIPTSVTILLPWALGEPSNWYSTHVPMHTSTWRDIIIVVLKFHPLCYLHLFILGCACAFVFRLYKFDKEQRTEEESESMRGKGNELSAVLDAAAGVRVVMQDPLTESLPRIKAITQIYTEPATRSRTSSSLNLWSRYFFVFCIENGATLGYTALGSIFYFSFLKPFGAKLSLRLGLLAPFHALVLLGLAGGRDILSKIFSHWILQTVGNWSYSQFIFQFVAFHLFEHITAKRHFSAPFFLIFLTAIAACGYNLIQLPLRNESRFKTSLKIFVLISFVWILVEGGIRNLFVSQLSSHAPLYVLLNHGCFDARLNLSTLHPKSFFINPSIVKSQEPDSYILMARQHLLEIDKNNKNDGSGNASITRMIYHSSLIRGRLNFRNGQLLQDGILTALNPKSTSSSTWIPCLAPPSYFPANKTFVQVETTGPQDPRLFWRGNDLWVSFFSMKPVDHVGDRCIDMNGRNGTEQEPLGSTFILPLQTTPESFISVAQELPLDPTRWARPRSSVEKNLLIFEIGGSLHYIYRVFPHIVYRFSRDEGGSNNIPQKFVGDSRLLSDLLLRPGVADDGLIAHGGASPIELNLPRRSRANKIYVASFHTTSSIDSTDYSHHLYIFEAERFDILAVSGRLPLVQQPGRDRGTFVSSLLQTDRGDFLVAYGSGDVESRVLYITHEMFLDLFSHFHVLKG